MYVHIIASGAVNQYIGQIRKAKLTVNTAFTGTITISDETGASGTPVVAVITNPTVGSVYEYWVLNNGICVNPNGACDITLNLDLSRAGTSM